MKAGIMVFSFFLFFAGIAEAAVVPAYDIQAGCKEVAGAIGGSAVIELQCRKDDTAAQKRIGNMNVDDGTMRMCDEVASSMGFGSYVILEQCIKDELEAKVQL